MNAIVVAALYQFVRIEDPEAIRQPLSDFLALHNIRGTLILATEGINGTVSGKRKSIDALYQWFKEHPPLNKVSAKESFYNEQPFYRTKVKIKSEIVTMGVEGIDPQRVVGTYVKPDEWNDLISDPDVLLIDTRNSYEVDIGTFKGAINPNTDTFRDFPSYVKDHLNPNEHKKVAMFCTGGIRCEKSTAFLKEQGFDEVYHLEGGILKYLEQVPQENSMWDGQCFVFDNRVSVGHNLEVGEYELCHACRRPLSVDDRKHPEFKEGVSCHLCFDQINDQQRQRFEERQKQLELARHRGVHHLGQDAIKTSEQRRKDKLNKRQSQRNKNRVD